MATFTNMLVAQIDAAPGMAKMPLSEQIALRAIARRLAAMAYEGATPEDWQQLAGCAEWATKRPEVASGSLATAIVHGQWVDWNGDGYPKDVRSMSLVQVRFRNGRDHGGRANSIHWQHTGGGHDVLAYCIVD